MLKWRAANEEVSGNVPGLVPVFWEVRYCALSQGGALGFIICAPVGAFVRTEVIFRRGEVAEV